MIKEIEVNSILNRNQHPSSWFGVNFGMNIYRGCQHGCIYCDSRSECYRIENFDDIIVKTNAPEILEKTLKQKRKKYTIGTGAMSDPYMPIEKSYQLTRQCLEIIEKNRFRVNIATKSNLILRDVDVLERIAKRYACVSFTVTTIDDGLAKKIEPTAPTSSERLKAMGILSEVGVHTGLLMMPQLPYIMESVDNLEGIVESAVKHGAKFIIPAFGVTLRDRQRVYYYDKLNQMEEFRDLSEKYKKRFGDRYSAGCVNYKKLREAFIRLCKENNISMEMPSYEKLHSVTQLSSFE